ncbi:hypothetical protein [Roseibium litorale]|uniref:Superfamily III holin-X n=1 Tax=Roseibium litorale TaxID=2803841 RepID=A0ABR9CLT3_9HYPH|nr:hypothetical protein [Roseibium litorale]MBD8891799.1 hypothetical protein [Roseibium litorale]
MTNEPIVPKLPNGNEQNIDKFEAQLLSLQETVASLVAEREGGELSDNAVQRQLLILEIKQRIRMRYTVTVLAIIVILAMASFAMHSVHSYFVGPVVLIPASLAIALFFAPIVSITAVTIMLLMGAFRRFKDDDMERVDMKALATAALKLGGGGS